jgi:hypothetical protein
MTVEQITWLVLLLAAWNISSVVAIVLIVQRATTVRPAVRRPAKRNPKPEPELELQPQLTKPVRRPRSKA